MLLAADRHHDGLGGQPTQDVGPAPLNLIVFIPHSGVHCVSVELHCFVFIQRGKQKFAASRRSSYELGRVFKISLEPLIIYIFHLISVNLRQLDVRLEVVVPQKTHERLEPQKHVLLVDLEV